MAAIPILAAAAIPAAANLFLGANAASGQPVPIPKYLESPVPEDDLEGAKKVDGIKNTTEVESLDALDMESILDTVARMFPKDMSREEIMAKGTQAIFKLLESQKGRSGMLEDQVKQIQAAENAKGSRWDLDGMIKQIVNPKKALNWLGNTYQMEKSIWREAYREALRKHEAANNSTAQNPQNENVSQNLSSQTTPVIYGDWDKMKEEQASRLAEQYRVLNAVEMNNTIRQTGSEFPSLSAQARMPDGWNSGIPTLDTRGDILKPDIQATKLMSDAAMLKKNGLVTPTMTDATLYQMKSVYNLDPKLMHNQNPETLLPQPQVLRDRDNLSAKKVIAPFKPLLESQLDWQERYNRLQSTKQTVGPETPLVRPYPSSQPQSSSDSSMQSTIHSQIENRSKQTADVVPYKMSLYDRYLNNNVKGGLQKDLGYKLVDDRRPVKSGSGFEKIVGDDIPTGGVEATATPMVGGGVATTSELKAANDAVNRSIIFDMLSKVEMIEQTLLSEFQVRTGATPTQAMNDVRANLNPIPVLYKYVQSNTSNALPGSTFQNCVPYDYGSFQQPGLRAIYGANTQSVHVLNTIPRFTDQAVPLVGNVTMQQLADLMSNTTIGEFASLLRVNTRSNNLDSLSVIMAKGYNPLMLKTGYSFADKLAKLLGYMATLWSIPSRDESEVQVPGTTALWPNPMTVPIPDAQPNPFPFILNSAEFDANRKWIGMIGYKTYADFITNRYDLSAIPPNPANGYNPYNPKYWDDQVAVCFVRAAELQDANVMFARALGQVAYPVCDIYTTATQLNIQQNMGVNIMVNGSKWKPWISTSAIAGPSMSLLFVVSDVETVPATQAFAWPGSGNLVAAYPAILENPGWNQASVAFFVETNNPLNAIMQEIRNWEDKYANNSDRASAMRWAANSLKMYCHPLQYNQGANTSTIDGLMFGGNSADNVYGTMVDLTQWRQRGRETTGMATTPLGLGRCRWTRNVDQPRYIANDPITGANDWKCYTTMGIGTSTHVLDFLIDRSWARPWEEYPGVRLYDAARTFLALNEMADCMASTYDLLMQVNSVDIYMHYGFTEYWDVLWSSNLSRWMDNTVYRAVREITNIGIQYPCFVIYDKAHMNCRRCCAPLAPLVYPGLISTNAVAENLKVYKINKGLFARISNAEMAKCNKAMTHTNPIISFGAYSRSGNVVMRSIKPGLYGTTVPTFQHAILLDKTLPSLMWEARKLSFTAVPGDLNMPYATLNGRFTDTQYALFLPITRPALWSRIATQFFAYNATVQPSLATSLPMGAFIPSEEIATGGDRYWFSMRVIRDAFAQGTSTSSIYTVIYFGSFDSIVGAPIMNDFNRQVDIPTDLLGATSFL